ncbi:tetratricopeptide repeat protein [Bradyrhizobium sp. LA7.1]|uniref:tetratricopeptide repeat protein n=1 Tax=Bradyrhizobium sp. LA7.1 TaxID=3156324 RepID=UPI0033912201
MAQQVVIANAAPLSDKFCGSSSYYVTTALLVISITKSKVAMKLKRAITAIVLVSVFAAPVAAGTFEDAVDAHARGDYAKALRLIRPLANDGDAAAQYNLALMYMTGRGVQQDYAVAAIWLRKAAEQGYAFAQSNLGTLYRDGRGVPENDAEAVVWFRKAADQGDPVAQFLLGGQYATGQGVAWDYAEALLWFQKAAEQGHPAARFYLGVMYAKGDGVPQDYVRAHMWFSLSAAQGNQEAVKTLEMAERKMTAAQIAEAQRLARDWKPATQPPPR